MFLQKHNQNFERFVESIYLFIFNFFVWDVELNVISFIKFL